MKKFFPIAGIAAVVAVIGGLIAAHSKKKDTHIYN